MEERGKATVGLQYSNNLTDIWPDPSNATKFFVTSDLGFPLKLLPSLPPIFPLTLCSLKFLPYPAERRNSYNTKINSDSTEIW
jgi:hypothetical protein